MSALKKKKSKGVSREALIAMAKESDNRTQRIEADHAKNTEEINSTYQGKELTKQLQEEEVRYLGVKAENEKRNKRDIEDLQHQLLNEIKQQFVAEQHAIMREYAEYETKIKDTFRNKEQINWREYTQKIATAIQKHNKKLRAFSGKSNIVEIPEFEPPTVDSILKCATIAPCSELSKIDEENAKNRKILRDELKKTKDTWTANEEAQIYSSLKELDAEYNARCERYRTKYNIERFYHVNNCKECKAERFTYIPMFNPKDKDAAAKILPLTAYFKPVATNIAPNTTASIANSSDTNQMPLLRPATHSGANEVLADFARQFIQIFVEFYNQEIMRIRDYEMAVPKEQNLAYTILHAEKIWTKVKSIKILDLQFNQKEDDEKVADFRKQEDKFYKDFPIVARYMVCLDTYNRVAFKKFLIKLIASNQKKNERGRNGLAKEGDSEDMWIELQADYVKYLYQEYNKTKHLSQAELRGIWKDTYELLKKEFGDFRKMYDDKIKQIEDEKKQQNAEMAKEVLGRLTTIQSVDTDTQYKLYIEMQNTLFQQRANKNLKALLANNPKIVVGVEGRGQSKEAGERMERDKKMKEAKQKNQPEAQIKNPVRHYYDSLKSEDDAHILAALKDLCYLRVYQGVQQELANRIRQCHDRILAERVSGAIVIEGDGTNLELESKWATERKKWVDERKHMMRPDEKIHVPYTRNLVRMYYDNNCRFEVA